VHLKFVSGTTDIKEYKKNILICLNSKHKVYMFDKKAKTVITIIDFIKLQLNSAKLNRIKFKNNTTIYLISTSDWIILINAAKNDYSIIV
jgi:hypothetical protein